MPFGLGGGERSVPGNSWVASNWAPDEYPALATPCCAPNGALLRLGLYAHSPPTTFPGSVVPNKTVLPAGTTAETLVITGLPARVKKTPLKISACANASAELVFDSVRIRLVPDCANVTCAVRLPLA